MNEVSAYVAQFLTSALQIFQPLQTTYGFTLSENSHDEFFAEIIFTSKSRYVKIHVNSHPHDYPYYINVVLGEGSLDWPETDWNSVALWRLKQKTVNEAFEYLLKSEDDVQTKIEMAFSDLIEYGKGFLNNDLQLFYEIRREQTRAREPYKIYQPDNEGKYLITYDAESVELKKKYSK